MPQCRAGAGKLCCMSGLEAPSDWLALWTAHCLCAHLALLGEGTAVKSAPPRPEHPITQPRLSGFAPEPGAKRRRPITGPIITPHVEPAAFAVPPDLQFEGGKLAAWYTEPAGAVVQLTEATIFTKEMAEWIVGPGFTAFNQRFPSRDQLRLLLDLRPMTSREPAARPVIMTAATRYLSMFNKVGVIAPSKPPPLYMTTLHAAVALLSAIGPEIRIFETLEGALKGMELSAAAPKQP